MVCFRGTGKKQVKVIKELIIKLGQITNSLAGQIKEHVGYNLMTLKDSDL